MALWPTSVDRFFALIILFQIPFSNGIRVTEDAQNYSIKNCDETDGSLRRTLERKGRLRAVEPDDPSGKPDDSFLVKISPWPLKPQQVSVNITFTFTPNVDVWYLSYQADVWYNGTHFYQDTKSNICEKHPEIHLCEHSAHELFRYSNDHVMIVPLPKGHYKARVQAYNQDWVMFLCAEMKLDL